MGRGAFERRKREKQECDTLRRESKIGRTNAGRGKKRQREKGVEDAKSCPSINAALSLPLTCLLLASLLVLSGAGFLRSSTRCYLVHHGAAAAAGRDFNFAG